MPPKEHQVKRQYDVKHKSKTDKSPKEANYQQTTVDTASTAQIHTSSFTSVQSDFGTKNSQNLENESGKPQFPAGLVNAVVSGNNVCEFRSSEGGMNWDVSIAPVVLHVVGEPCPKPSTGTQLVNDRIRENLRRVSSNIRRRKMVIWMLVFSFLLIWGGFCNLLIGITSENDDIFSMIVIKPWLLPGLACEISITGLGFILMAMRMKFMHSKALRLVYRIIMGFNSFQYLILMIALPIAVFFFFTELSAIMKSQLVAGNVVNIASSWTATQTDRKCCGFHNRTDWLMPEQIHEDDDDEVPLLPDQEVYYPPSCCNLTHKLAKSKGCTESLSNLIWKRGCHDVEFSIVLDYLIASTGLLIIAFALNVAIKLRIFKLERYLLIFRPHELF